MAAPSIDAAASDGLNGAGSRQPTDHPVRLFICPTQTHTHMQTYRHRNTYNVAQK